MPNPNFKFLLHAMLFDSAFFSGIENELVAIIQSGLYTVNPFLPTGQYLAPKLIILIKCFMDIYFSKCSKSSLCRTRWEIGITIMLRS